jgi:integrase
MREGGWEEATKDVNIRDFEHYIKPKLGERTLAEFDKFVLQLHLNALAKADYSKPVIQRVKTLLSSLFLEAVELEFLLKNPMSQKKVRMPKCKPQHKPVIDAADVRRLYSSLSSLRDRLIFRLGVFLGPRTSEVFGFTVND